MTITAEDIVRINRIYEESKRGMRAYPDDSKWLVEKLIEILAMINKKDFEG